MNCDTVKIKIRDLAKQAVSDQEWMVCMAHVENCPNCRAALRGTEALLEIGRRPADEPDDEMFDRVMAAAMRSGQASDGNRRFWMGTAFGGAIAASLFAVAMFFGDINSAPEAEVDAASFAVALNEPRQMNLAFETDRDLPGAVISIELTGSVQLEGYGSQRELKWTEDLEAGTNRLSLPVLASGMDGGQMVVRLSHPMSEQVFVVNLPTGT